MLEFQPRERAYLSGIHALSQDQDNNEVFVGMTAAESVWYANYVQQSYKGEVTRGDEAEARYLALHDQHEQARCAVLAAESLLQSFETSTQ
ncbi:hypothetical protein E5C31_10150 [Providencia rettgeri]|uniref:Uncharacterized protein n=1 Tax=Alcaligenes parafaecalis TaxID=171260 RepID=A0ABT3VHW2_9BURK|nr:MULTISPECIES: hypothetical protein [Alcaligenes]MBY6346322.1 hypothetical protein [Providencia rettgeri]MCX5463068.1 hypothetical protein [Alcaligenes parafaecalis]QTC00546.1 hypothetical protein JYG33_03500 [Alcaligenes sp. SORT26]